MIVSFSLKRVLSSPFRNKVSKIRESFQTLSNFIIILFIFVHLKIGFIVLEFFQFYKNNLSLQTFMEVYAQYTF
jgi:hypothetical protein